MTEQLILSVNRWLEISRQSFSNESVECSEMVDSCVASNTTYSLGSCKNHKRLCLEWWT